MLLVVDPNGSEGVRVSTYRRAAGLFVVFGVALGMAASVLWAVAAEARPARGFDLQAHRGGMGLRPESTLSSFGNGMQLGVSTLELDVQITEDGVAVVTHDRQVSPRPCQDTEPAFPNDPEYPYVGKYVKDLTLEQIKTLDCGTRRPTDPNDPYVKTMEMVPGSQMPTLAEVFRLVKRYGADGVMLNVETKVEAGAPQETAPREQFVRVTAREVRRAGFLDRVTIQSFDWGALMRMREVEPRLPLVALTNKDFLECGQPGASPWLGGIDADDYDCNLVRAADSFGADAISPVHGSPQNGAVTDPDYEPYVTKRMVNEAHAAGMKVVPWTVNDKPTMRKLIDDGVDGIITDYPDRLRGVMREYRLRLPKPVASPFDVQAHRGGRMYRPENTLAAFRYALDDLDVSTLELDTGITEDGRIVVSHEREISARLCSDTAPAKPNDPEYPYVGDLIKDLTLQQIRTLDCGSKTQPDLPKQKAVPGAKMPTLARVFRTVKESGRDDVRLNVETKLSPLAPEETVSPEVFAEKLVRATEAAGMEGRTTIQSFDWRTIRESRRLNPEIETVALVWQYGPEECGALSDECSLRAVYDDPKVKSPWTAPQDWWKVRDLGKLVRRAGASTVSANWQVHDPDQKKVESEDFYLRQDPRYFHGPEVAKLQARGLKVVPYTVNDEATMQRVIELGVDGIISDDHELLALVAKRNGLR
jgi:glycerophosphoryl diester phosphodiesterase